MEQVIGDLAPDGEPLRPGPLVRLSLNDVRDIPSIQTAYSPPVPILHASSGIRRIVGLAYILIWSWREHMLACDQLGEELTSQVTMLVDEIESHLHPRWQRSILKSLFHAVDDLHSVNDDNWHESDDPHPHRLSASVQLIVATHSPLILASGEPMFDPEQGAWFDLDLAREQGSVSVQKRPFIRQGTSDNWLMSEAFDLSSGGRSLEGEQAISDAKRLLERRRDEELITDADIKKVSESLRATLPDIDRFWIRWDAAFNVPEKNG
jgi:hypothetical protein